MKTLKYPAILAVGLGLSALTAVSRADYLQATAGGGGGVLGTQSDTGTTSASVSSSQGGGSALVSYGGVSLQASAVSNSTAHPLYNASGAWYDTITIVNPALTGQTGTARFTFSISGGFDLNSTAFNTAINYADVYWDKEQTNLAVEFEVNTGTVFDPAFGTVTSFSHDYDFTYGTPFSINPGAVVRASGGSTGGTASVNLRIAQTGMSVTSNGNPTPYTSSSNTGSALATVATSGTSFLTSPISLANSGLGSHGTSMSIIDGTTTADRTVSASFVGAAALGGTGGTVGGDALSLTGLGDTPGQATDTFTLRMSYNEADMIAQFGSESNLSLLWLNPATNLWQGATDGNFGGTPFFAGDGAYNPGTDFQLGYYGVDTADNYVWAVLDHNSEFAVGQLSPTPEPSSAVLLASGLVAWIPRRRRRGTA